jgi:hypothetical protein
MGSTAETEGRLRRQLSETFETARFPLREPADLLRAMAEGHREFAVGDEELAALELALAVGDDLSFPYRTAEDLVDDVVAGVTDAREP